MIRSRAIALLALLAACSKSPEAAREQMRAFDVAEPAPAPADATPQQIAYTYQRSYRLAGDRIANVQDRQATLCRRLTAARCILLESNLGTTDDRTAGSIALLVDARLAVGVGQRLDAIVGAADGEVAERKTTAEDVTKQMVDTDARVRAKAALSERLLALIRSPNGKVGDLIAAEKAYADNQEELDAARSLQATLRQRVAMSRLDITYESIEETNALAPLRRSLSAAGDTLGTSVGTLITFIVAALPWALALSALIWLWRRLGLRGPLRRWRDRRSAAASASGDAVA